MKNKIILWLQNRVAPIFTDRITKLIFICDINDDDFMIPIVMDVPPRINEIINIHADLEDNEDNFVIQFLVKQVEWNFITSSTEPAPIFVICEHLDTIKDDEMYMTKIQAARD